MTSETQPLDLAIQRLYENEALTNYCTDEPAQLLLGWGESQLRDLSATDQETLDGTVRQLERAMRTINRLVGQHYDIDETQLMQRLIKLVEQAMQLAQTKAVFQQVTEADTLLNSETETETETPPEAATNETA